MCPVCTVAVGAGIGLSRWLGIDDAISGVWIGGFLLGLTIWTTNVLGKKFNKYLIFAASIIFYYGLTYWGLDYYNVINFSCNTICGLDKLVFGVLLGTLVSILGIIFNNSLKKANNNKVYFPFQKVVIPVGILLLTSFVLNYFI